MYPTRMITAPRNPQMGQVGIVAPKERENLIKITSGLAMTAGGIFSIMSIAGASKTGKVALGALGGGLLLTGALNIYDALA